MPADDFFIYVITLFNREIPLPYGRAAPPLSF